MGSKSSKARKNLLASLQERAKELNCLYEVEEILNNTDLSTDGVLEQVVGVIAPGWQFPSMCQAQITYEGKVFRSGDFKLTPWVLTASIVVQNHPVGALEIYYTEECPSEDEGPFLKEEMRLANSIAERLGQHILHQKLKNIHEQMESTGDGNRESGEGWRRPIQLLRQSDRELYMRIRRKMLNHLFAVGVQDRRTLVPMRILP